MKERIKKIAIYIIEWVIVGAIIVLIVYPRNKTGTIKELALDKCSNDMSRYTVRIYDNEPDDKYYRMTFNFSTDAEEEKDNAEKLIQYLSNVKVKEKDKLSKDDYLYVIIIIDKNAASTELCVYKDNIIEFDNKNHHGNYEIEENGDSMKGVLSLLKEIGYE